MNLKIDQIFRLVLDSFSKLMSKQEELVGIDITPQAIRLCQLTNNKNEWLLTKLAADQVGDGNALSAVEGNKDLYVEKLKALVRRAKLETANVAISIPITSAIIRVVTLPLMKDDEIRNAIEFDSLWENVLQLDDKLDEYSIFWQIIQKKESSNTMDLLFVASKLSEINAYTELVARAGLNPLIVDVRCFAIRNSLKLAIDEGPETIAIIESGIHENYVLIVSNGSPYIYDIYLSDSDKLLLQSGIPEGEVGERFFDRYVSQVRQAFKSYETKSETGPIARAMLVTQLDDSETFLNQLKGQLTGYRLDLLDPTANLIVPTNIRDQIASDSNKSVFASALGLATRKADVFGYYKYVTGVNNVNLLPNKDSALSQQKKKIFSKYGLIGTVAGVLVFVLLTTLYFLYANNSVDNEYGKAQELQSLTTQYETQISQNNAAISKYKTMLDATKKFPANQKTSFELLSSVSRSVPPGVWFTELTFEDPSLMIIKGDADNDSAIVLFVDKLQQLPQVTKASLQSMSADITKISKKSHQKKYEIRVSLSLAPAKTN